MNTPCNLLLICDEIDVKAEHKTESTRRHGRLNIDRRDFVMTIGLQNPKRKKKSRIVSAARQYLSQPTVQPAPEQ